MLNETQPRHILEKIVWYKEQEVARMKTWLTPIELKRQVLEIPPARDFLQALQSRPNRPSLIA